MPREIGLDVLTLVRGAIDAKIECWRNLSAAEKTIGLVELSEDALEDLVIGIDSSAQLTNEQLTKWILNVVGKDG